MKAIALLFADMGDSYVELIATGIKRDQNECAYFVIVVVMSLLRWNYSVVLLESSLPKTYQFLYYFPTHCVGFRFR